MQRIMCGNMDRFIKKIENFIIKSLIIIMVIIILLSIIDLVYIIIKDALNPPLFFLEDNELLDIFGLVLLVFIGVELLETIKAYAINHVIHSEIVITTALLALARKVITLDTTKTGGATIAAIGVVILSLSIAYYFLKRAYSKYPESRITELMKSLDDIEPGKIKSDTSVKDKIEKKETPDDNQ